jgi:LPXTG-motif cell wall-anchored protein
LPRTGGFSGSYATLLGLSVGVLLVGGGLVVRRVSR